MEAARRHADPFGHRSVHPITEPLARSIEIIKTPACHRIVRIDHCGGLANDAIPLLPPLHGLSGLGDAAAEFVTKHYWIVHGPAVGGTPLVQVAAAHTHGGYFEEHVL